MDDAEEVLTLGPDDNENYDAAPSVPPRLSHGRLSRGRLSRVSSSGSPDQGTSAAVAPAAVARISSSDSINAKARAFFSKAPAPERMARDSFTMTGDQKRVARMSRDHQLAERILDGALMDEIDDLQVGAHTRPLFGST
jgi:hypothetical protein